MHIVDDTPEPGSVPAVYPKRPPVNSLLDPKQRLPANLFAFEGIDGSGKSTVVREVARRLADEGRSAAVFRLGRSDLVRHALPRATWLNADPITLNLLNWVSIFEQVTERSDLLNSSTALLFDRYILTIKVRGILEGLGTDFMNLLELRAPRPRLFFLLDCDPAVSCDRILASGRGITYFEAGARIVPHEDAPMIERDPDIRRTRRGREAMLLEHLTRMRNQFLALAGGYHNVHILDTSAPLAEVVDEVARCIDAAI
jgi:thymidylate kinase